jgi:hypothetical protein
LIENSGLSTTNEKKSRSINNQGTISMKTFMILIWCVWVPSFCITILGTAVFPDWIVSISMITMMVVSIYIIYLSFTSNIFDEREKYLSRTPEDAGNVILKWGVTPKFKNVLIAYKGYLLFYIVVAVCISILIKGIGTLANPFTYITAVVVSICFVFVIGGTIMRILITSEGVMIRNNFKKWVYFNSYTTDENLKIIKLNSNRFLGIEKFFPYIIFADEDTFYNAKDIISNYLKQI